MRVPRAVLLAVAAATALSGCSPSDPGSGLDSDTDRAVTASATGTGPEGSVPDEESALTEVPGEDSRGPESPDPGGAGGVRVSLPSLPIGGAEDVSSGVEDTCITASYLGDFEEQRIPVGARIRVTTVHFSSDLLVRGGNGCSPGRRSCLGGDAFTDEKRACDLPVHVAREPRPPAGEEPDPEGEQETVTVRMAGEVDCARALKAQCADFARSLVGVPDQTVSVTVNGPPSPSPKESSPDTAPGPAPETSGVPETSAGTSPDPSRDPATGASPSSG